jgi:hypothetical protein
MAEMRENSEARSEAFKQAMKRAGGNHFSDAGIRNTRKYKIVDQSDERGAMLQNNTVSMPMQAIRKSILLPQLQVAPSASSASARAKSNVLQQAASRPNHWQAPPPEELVFAQGGALAADARADLSTRSKTRSITRSKSKDEEAEAREETKQKREILRGGGKEERAGSSDDSGKAGEELDLHDGDGDSDVSI